ncbi:hypothetical protein [Streptomyces sp. NPDC001389]|uniref:hypothetical protein n=1 Tax=unclassified Streptomyces TaxID=2593676 RepID=UPI0036C61C1D
MTNGRGRTARLLSLTALPALILLTGACGTPHPGARIEHATQSPDTRPPGAEDPRTPQPSMSSPAAVGTIGPAPEDLHTVDWAHTPVPGDICGVPGLVRFDEKGEAWGTSRTWGPVLVNLQRDVAYGDIDGDGRDEAAVTIGCHNGGGTAAGRLAWGGVLIGRTGGNLTVIGTLTPRQQLPQSMPTQVAFQIALHQVVVHENWFRDGDSTCCPSGTAITVWTHDGDRLTPGAPQVTS